MLWSNIRLFFILLIQETTQHRSCCLRKEVDGIKYEHIDDHDMTLPNSCKDHCVYKKVGDTEDMHYCFGVGNLVAKCLKEGEHEECPIERPVDVFVPPARTNRTLTVKTAQNELVYGPWSDERLSAFQFEALLDKRTATLGSVSLSFSPCYKCNLVYETIFDLYTNGNSLGFLNVNGFRRLNNKPFAYTLGENNPPAKFLVQTIPQTEGKFRIKTQFVNDNGSKQDIYDYTTTVPEDGTAPFGITYAVFGNTFSNNAATYSFNDVDRAPEFYPIADCREGENTGLTAETSTSVKVTRLDIDDPVDIKNVDPSQLWCVVSNGNPCACTPTTRQGRGHITPQGPEGTVINRKFCKFLKAAVPSASIPGELTLVDDINDATKFQFIVAPNTEINQLRFGDNNVAPFTTYVISWNTTADFESGVGFPVSKIGRETNPLTSCFKAYKFLSNIQ